LNGTEVCREGRQVCNSVLTISCQVIRIYACSSLYLLCILMLSVSIITLCALSRLFVQLHTMIALSRQAKALSSEDIWNITIYNQNKVSDGHFVHFVSRSHYSHLYIIHYTRSCDLHEKWFMKVYLKTSEYLVAT
jgi:hypothetical protein